MSSQFDPLGDTIGGLSLLAQAFGACARGLDVWQRGKGIAEESAFIQVKLEILAARFKAWGCGWGVVESSVHAPSPKFGEYAELATDCINLITYQTNSLETLDKEFPSLIIAADGTSKPGKFAFLAALADPQSQQDLESLRDRKPVSAIKDGVTLRETLNWGWQDGKALKKLAILESLIDGLYQLLPPPVDDPVAAVVFNSSLGSTNSTTLDAIRDMSAENSLQASLAWLRSTIVKFETRSTLVQDKEIRKRWSELSKVRNSDSRNSRAVGTYQDADVLIEWKTVPSGNVPMAGMIIDKRIKDVARLLQSDLKPEELRTLSCVGVIEKIDEDKTKYGLLYSLPSPSTNFSLRDVLYQRNFFFLGDYFTIAKILSKALLCLHLAGWLHKGIRSDNILFFANHATEVLPTHPYIVGFEYSRGNAQNEMTEELADNLEFNLYRHPDCQGVPVTSVENEGTAHSDVPYTKKPYRAEFDIYSLGVILVEMGIRKTAEFIFDQAKGHRLYGKHTPERFRSWLMDMMVPELGKRMGRLYMEATLLCLSGDFNATMSMEAAFYLDVVKKLESCNA